MADPNYFNYDLSGGPNAPPDPVFLTGSDLVHMNEQSVVMTVVRNRFMSQIDRGDLEPSSVKTLAVGELLADYGITI